MKLTLKRIVRKATYTIGKLYIDGKYYCDTLEDKDRELDQRMSLTQIRAIKVMHETAIPAGKYKVIVNMSPSKRRMLPRLQNVPGFSGILIHRGNTARDSSGCILVGENKIEGKLINSAPYELDLTEKLLKSQGAIIEII